ncbi:MAG: hypothetical protein AAFQ68_28865, partial [Bacteroidota bacterium]
MTPQRLKRSSSFQVSTTYLDRKASYIVAGFAFVATLGMLASVLLLSPEQMSDELPPEVLYIMIGVFAFAGWSFIKPYFGASLRPTRPLQYDPAQKGKQRLKAIGIGIVFVGAFLYIFHVIPLGRDADEMIYLVYFFDVMMALMFLWQIGIAIKLILQAQRFGKSDLRLMNGTEFSAGDLISLEFHNQRLAEQGTDLRISLHNIEESWDVGGRKKQKSKNTNGLITDIL